MDLVGILTQFAYILPLVVIIYKLGALVSEHNQLKSQLDKLEESYGVHITNETLRYNELMKQLNELSKAITRIETKLEKDKSNK